MSSTRFDLNEVERKAEVLIEALPYIRKFNRKIVVVKYGGAAMIDEELKEDVIKDVTLLKLVGFKPIIVHGGGKEISRWVGKVGMEAQFINGLRVTDEPTMEIVEMVLNKVNKRLVAMVEELGVPELAGLPCRELGSFVYRHDFGTGVTEYELDHVFVAPWDGAPNPDPTECSEWRWVPAAEVMRMLLEEPQALTVWFVNVASLVLADICG